MLRAVCVRPCAQVLDQPLKDCTMEVSEELGEPCLFVAVLLLLRSLPVIVFHRLLSWCCCCDHCLSSSFTAFCRGAAAAITACRHLSPPFVVVLLLPSG